MGVVLISIIVILGLFGRGYKKYGWPDAICFLLVVGALILWKVTSDPVIAIWLAIGADFFASVPTCIKAYKDPMSETWITYFITIFAAIAGAFSSTIYDLPNLLWPTYLVIGNVGLLGLFWMGFHKKRRRKH